MMRRKTKFWILALGLAFGAAVAAQTGALDALVQKVQELLTDKPLDAATFMNLAGPGDKPVDGELGNAFSELEAQPEVPTALLLATIAGELPNKVVAVEHGFLASPKEPGLIGNEFFEEPRE